MQEIDRVKEDLGDIISDCVNRQSFTTKDLDNILSLKIDGTTLKELLKKLDETGGRLAVIDDIQVII